MDRASHRVSTFLVTVVCAVSVVMTAGCGGGGGGSAATTAANATGGTLSGLAALTGSNQASLVAALRSGTVADTATIEPLSLLDSVSGLTVRILSLGGDVLSTVTTDGTGHFTVTGLPMDQTLIVIIEAQGKTMLTFARIPSGAGTSIGLVVDPLSALVADRIQQIFVDRGIELGNLVTVEPAAIAAQIREVLAQLRELYDTRIDVTLAQLTGNVSDNATLFDQQVPRSLLDATGNPLAMAESSADFEVGDANGILLALSRRLYHTHFPLIFSMSGQTPQPIQDWVATLPDDAKFGASPIDGSPWPGSGPILVANPFIEPNRNQFDEEEREDGGPPIDGPVFNETQLQQIVTGLASGQRYSLGALHRIFFRPSDAGGAGFLMGGEGRFGDIHAPYILTGPRAATVIPIDDQTHEPDFTGITPFPPPFEYTFSEYLGPVPSLDDLRRDLFQRRRHIDHNPTGGPREFVACQDDGFWEQGPSAARPIRVNVTLDRENEGRLTSGTVTESSSGAYHLGFTDRSEGVRGEFRFIRVDSGRELKTEFGRPLRGARTGFVDLAAGVLDIEAIFDTHAVTETFVFGGPPVRLAGSPHAVIYSQREGGYPVRVAGPSLSMEGTWNTSVTFTGFSGAGQGFFLAFTETTFPYEAGTSEVVLIESQSGEPVTNPDGTPTRVLISRIEGDLGMSFSATFNRLYGCEIPNPRHDPELDPYFDDLNSNGRRDDQEPTFASQPFIPPEIRENFTKNEGDQGYLGGGQAYHVDSNIYSRPDGTPLRFDDLPQGFDPDRSPRDNGLRLRLFRPRENGFFYQQPMTLLNLFLAAFPPSFFDGRHAITEASEFDFLQSLALIQLRFESDKIVEDVTVDIDSGETTRLHQLPALPFRIFSGTDDISQIMTRVMGAFANVPE